MNEPFTISSQRRHLLTRPLLTRRLSTRRAFTLVEASISVAIVAVLATASLSAMGTASTTKLRQTDLSRGYALATLFMSEILRQPYVDPVITGTFGPETGEVRATFDDVDDYAGYTQTTPTYQNGTAIPGYTNWKIYIAVVYADSTNPGAAAAASDQGLKRITITVTDPRGRKTTLVGLRSKYGRVDQIPSATSTYLNYAAVDLQVGTNTNASVSSGVNPLNVVP
jgi:MSHA pilin protein MshD